MMISNIVSVKSKNGMHLRPAGVLSQIASNSDYKSIGIFLIYNGVRADAKSVFNLMGLGAFCGATIIVEIEFEEGDDATAEKALADIVDFFEEGYKKAEVPEDL